MNTEIHTILKRRYALPKSEAIKNVVTSFSITGRILFFLFVAIFVGSGLFLLAKVNKSFLVEIPTEGGTLVEGVVGLPRFINPVLSITDTGEDLVRLVYSGLLKKDVAGNFVPDLAQEYIVSEDGRSYTFILKNELRFHDGELVTTDDIEFTIQRIQDPLVKSPRRANYEGVEIEKVDARTIKFTLKQPYSWFLENLTIGILPKHIWKDVSQDEFQYSNFNIKPIGTGPYMVDKIKNNTGGIPAYYVLSRFKGYADERPLIKNIVIRFYQNEEKLVQAYMNGEIESINSVSPEQASLLAKKGVRIEETSLPRIFGVFFNHNEAPIFNNKEVKKALDEAVDKERIVNEILFGYAKPISSPLPIGLANIAEASGTPVVMDETARIAKATSTLESNGWKLNDEGVREKTINKEKVILSFSVSTSNAPELKAIANMLKGEWEKIGARVEVKFFETGDLNQSVIRPRKYDALLFGQIINRDLDLFAFWHSSQRNDPGLNISAYANATVDKLLEDARTLATLPERKEKYMKFEEEIRNDIPALFIYSPSFLYVIPKKVQGANVAGINNPADRFTGIEHWYIDMDKVWKIFL